MTIEQLRKIHQKQPFEAFDIHLADGRFLPVRHPENIAFSGQGRTIGVAVDDGTIEILDLLLVTSLKPHANGSSASKRRRPQ